MDKDQDKQAPAALNEDALDAVQGGLLLPAVQKVREAAARLPASTSTGVTDGTSN